MSYMLSGSFARVKKRTRIFGTHVRREKNVFAVHTRMITPLFGRVEQKTVGACACEHRLLPWFEESADWVISKSAHEVNNWIAVEISAVVCVSNGKQLTIWPDP